MELIAKAIPEPTSQELENACVLACQEAVGAGLTGVHWLVDSAQEIRVLQKLHSERKLPLRVYLGIAVNLLDDLVNLGLCTGFGDDMVKVGFVKILADGSLGGHTASMKEPYSDKPETRGMMLYAQEELNKLASKANEAGLQLGIHAIGDHAIEAVTQAFEKALRKVPRKDHRHRIEHCSVLNPKLIKRMKNLELIASAQPHFIFSDFWVLDRVGKSRARWVYPLKTLVREGLVVASGSDCPVEPINPLFGVWAAVDRKDFPQENLSVEEALKTYTINAAYASFDEDKKGTIERGKFGDLTVLSDDLTSIPCDRIRDVKIEMVIVGGKIVHVRK
jgi:predicted amidohydrolase YtcJ